MHRVGGAGSSAGSTRPRKEKRLTYVINHADNTKHCAGINCLAYLNASVPGTSDYLFTGSRDGTLRRWEIKESDAIFSATFESHVDWVNDAIIVGQSLVSCSSHYSEDGACTRTLSGHSDYVIRLAAAEKNSNVVASGGLGGEVLIWDLDAALSPVTKSVEATEDKVPNGNFGPSMETLRNLNSNVINNGQSHGYSPISAKGHKESVYALAMNDAGNLLVSGGTEKINSVPNSEVDHEPKNRASKAHPAFEFSTTSPPSIITEGSYGGPWRKRITDLVGTEGEEYIPKWCVDCKFEGEFPREAAKCRFFLRPTEGSPVSNIREDKLIAPWISRILNAAIHVITYLPAGLLNGSSDGIQPRQKLKPSVDILCNDQASVWV